MLEWVIDTISALGYWGIAMLMFLENLFPPIPSEIIMPLAGFAATKGELDLIPAAIAGTIGSFLGALFWYYVGLYLGQKRIEVLADRYGRWISLSSQDVRDAKQWFDRQGGWATGLCRMIPGVRTWISVPAGISRMNLPAFVVTSTIGTAMWVSLLTYAGYLLGNNYERVAEYLAPVGKITLVIMLIVTIVWVLKRKSSSNERS
ncbi:DedA family protein [Oscillatoriales cyanobacterium LEGE 11467]|uniref:DedA family protein n=1 Tax=Zarconia navalis LEGE 11467 TaxID=1828826 RepID=A0A928Z9K6_9CYAN|nr:DedA family protein [Zarconia navalis]MBE9042760.1 DedA family protein [Zarconia navalis LEGE 11467]